MKILTFSNPNLKCAVLHSAAYFSKAFLFVNQLLPLSFQPKVKSDLAHFLEETTKVKTFNKLVPKGLSQTRLTNFWLLLTTMFSLWSFPQENVPNHYPQLFTLG